EGGHPSPYRGEGWPKRSGRPIHRPCDFCPSSARYHVRGPILRLRVDHSAGFADFDGNVSIGPPSQRIPAVQNLDDIDRRIIAELQKDGRASVSAVSSAV